MTPPLRTMSTILDSTGSPWRATLIVRPCRATAPPGSRVDTARRALHDPGHAGHRLAESRIHPARPMAAPRLYALPTVVVLVPLAAGVTPGMLAMLITGYALTGYMEEAMWRGVVLRVLRPTGTMQAVLIGSLLFGAAHLSNIMFRESAALVAAQALGSFCGGIGYAALRLRTNTIWPVMALHMAGDLIASIGALPKIPTLVTHDVIMLAFGLYLLHRNTTHAD